MTQQAYRNLSQGELDMADHYAETGNCAGLRRMQELSASKEGRMARQVDQETYYNPIRLQRD